MASLGAQIKPRTTKSLDVLKRIAASSDVVEESKQWAETQRARLNLWADSLGVFADGKLSVEHRFRENEKVASLVARLLQTLCNGLLLFLKISSSSIQPDGDGSNDKPSKLEGSSQESEDDTSEDEPSLPQIKDDVEADILRLVRLSRSLRQFGTEKTDARGILHEPRDRDGKSLVDRFNNYGGFVYDRELKPARADFHPSGQLKDRLVKAMAKRFRLMTYRVHHSQQMASVSITKSDPIIMPVPVAPTAETLKPATQLRLERRPSAVKTIASKTVEVRLKATFAKSDKASTAARSYTPSKMASTAPGSVESKGQDVKLEYPKRPKFQSGQKEYLCPHCQILRWTKDVDTDPKWESHVMHDLQPYVCLVADCEDPHRLFRTSEEWTKHMTAAHSTAWWTCTACETEPDSYPNTFSSEVDFQNHVETTHPEYVQHLPILLKHNRHQPPYTFEQCPLCGLVPSVKEGASNGNLHDNLLHHIAGDHLKPLALVCLPWEFSEPDNATSGKTVDVGSQDRRANEEPVTTDGTGSTVQQGRTFNAASLKEINNHFGKIEDRNEKIERWLIILMENIGSPSFSKTSPPDFDSDEDGIQPLDDSLSLSLADQAIIAWDNREKIKAEIKRREQVGETSRGQSSESGEVGDMAVAFEYNVDNAYRFGDIFSSPSPTSTLTRIRSIESAQTTDSTSLRQTSGDDSARTFTALHEAALFGSVHTISRQLDQGDNLEAEHKIFGTALHFAILGGQLSNMNFLLSKGARPDTTSGRCGTPLHVACMMNNLEAVELLLRCGAQLDTKAMVWLRIPDRFEDLMAAEAKSTGQEPQLFFLPPEGKQLLELEWVDGPPLWVATFYGRYNIAQLLLKYGANVDGRTSFWFERSVGQEYPPRSNLNHTGSGFTALQAAALVDRADLISLLLENGADLRALDSDGDDAVTTAAGIGNIRALEALKAGGADLNNSTHGHNRTALMRAAQYGYTDCVKFLLGSGVDVDIGIESPNKYTPLLVAAIYGQEECVQLLLAAGANPNTMHSSGMSAISAAAARGYLRVIKYLAKWGALMNGPEGGTIPLILAAASGYYDCVRFIVQHGADLDRRDETGSTAIMCAAANGYLDIVEYLVERGAEIGLVSTAGLTALGSAVYYGYANTVSLLIEAGADVEARNGVGDTPLICAVSQNDIRSAEELLKSGASPNNPNDSNVTPLHVAVEHGSIDCVQLLCQRGAAIDGHTGVTSPLDVAARRGNAACLRILLEHKADPNVRNELGDTPLMTAASENYIESVNALLDYKAATDVQNVRGETAAGRAVKCDGVICLHVLLAADVNVDEVDYRGRTLLIRAATAGSSSCLRHLLRSSAYLDHQDYDGYTALMMAVRARETQCAQYLLEQGAGVDLYTFRLEKSAWLFAAESANAACIELLLRTKSAPDRCDGHGKTPLLAAIMSEDAQCINLLVKRLPSDEIPNNFAERKALEKLSSSITTMLRPVNSRALDRMALDILKVLKDQVQQRLSEILAEDPSRTLPPEVQQRLIDLLASVRRRRQRTRRAGQKVRWE